MSDLRWVITDLLGDNGVAVNDHADGEVIMPLNGGRTASVKVSLWDIASQEARFANLRLLKAWYAGLPDPVFSGVIFRPKFQGKEGYVEIAAQDGSRRLDAAPMLNPMKKYSSLDQIVELARPTAYLLDPAVPDHGVKAHVGADRGPMPGMDISKGASAWRVMTDASQSAFGPDFDLRPIDHVPGTYDYCELDIWARRGAELQDDPALAFHFGWGRNNCVDFSEEPGGDRQVDAFWAGLPDPPGQGLSGGDPAGTDLGRPDGYPYNRASNAQFFEAADELLDYGLYGAYESPQGCFGAAAKGIATVAGYRVPPRFITFTPAMEGASFDLSGEPVDGEFGIPPRVLEDYGNGDTIRVVAKRGLYVANVPARVTQIALKERDQAGNVQAEVSVVPRVDTSGIDSGVVDLSGLGA